MCKDWEGGHPGSLIIDVLKAEFDVWMVS